jgi:hypothetical protein
MLSRFRHVSFWTFSLVLVVLLVASSSSAAPKRTLTVTKAGTGTGTVTSSPAGINCGATCTFQFNNGTSVTLTEVPAQGSFFAGWSGVCSGTNTTCPVQMNGNKAVTATFTLNPPPPACSDGIDNDGDTLIDYPADPGCTSASDTSEVDPSGDLLSWAPPTLVNPITIIIADDGSNRVQMLNNAQDYIIDINDFNASTQNGISIWGGHNIKIIGGRITMGTYPAVGYPSGLTLNSNVGTVHVEGLDIGGAALIDAIRIQNTQGGPTSASIIQFENVHVHAQVPPGYTINEHPDLLQLQNYYPGLIRVDKMTGDTSYQGVTVGDCTGVIKADGGILLKRTNMHPFTDQSGQTTNTYLFQEYASTPFTLDQVWAPAWNGKGIENMVYPDQFNGRSNVCGTIPGDNAFRAQDATGFYAAWPTSAAITGKFYEGNPPAGDYVPAGVAGVNYVSPGYQ